MELFTRIRETNSSSLIYFFIFPENKIQVTRKIWNAWQGIFLCQLRYCFQRNVNVRIWLLEVSRYHGTISNSIGLNGLVVRAIEEITNHSPELKHSSSSISAFHCLKTAKGQTRFLIRAALKHHWLLNICEAVKTFPDINLFYRQDALLLEMNSGGRCWECDIRDKCFRYRFGLI